MIGRKTTGCAGAVMSIQIRRGTDTSGRGGNTGERQRRIEEKGASGRGGSRGRVWRVESHSQPQHATPPPLPPEPSPSPAAVDVRRRHHDRLQRPTRVQLEHDPAHLHVVAGREAGVLERADHAEAVQALLDVDHRLLVLDVVAGDQAVDGLAGDLEGAGRQS